MVVLTRALRRPRQRGARRFGAPEDSQRHLAGNSGRWASCSRRQASAAYRCGSSLLGFFLGFLLMLPGHVLGSTGAGDVKLFAAAGAVLGVEQIVPAFLMTAIAGGAAGRVDRVAPRPAAADVSPDGSPVRTCARAEGRHRIAWRAQQFPYGPAIAVGCVLSADVRCTC